MKVYITYDRYERDEWYNVYYISTSKKDSIKHCKEVDLVNFISCGPDDCHSFKLQEVEMTKEQYNQLMKWFDDDSVSLENYGEDSSDYFKFMFDLYDQTGVVGNKSVIISTDGCTDNIDIIHFYGKENRLDTTDDDVYYEVEEKLFSDETLYDEVLKKYINETY